MLTRHFQVFMKSMDLKVSKKKNILILTILKEKEVTMKFLEFLDTQIKKK